MYLCLLDEEEQQEEEKQVDSYNTARAGACRGSNKSVLLVLASLHKSIDLQLLTSCHEVCEANRNELCRQNPATHLASTMRSTSASSSTCTHHRTEHEGKDVWVSVCVSRHHTPQMPYRCQLLHHCPAARLAGSLAATNTDHISPTRHIPDGSWLNNHPCHHHTSSPDTQHRHTPFLLLPPAAASPLPCPGLS